MRNYADDNDLHYMWNKIHVKVNQKASELELAIDESARHGRIVKIIVQHCLANARSLITGQTFDDIQYSPWQDTLPGYISGKYYWARSVIYYVDGTIVYSDPYFDMGAQVTAEVNIAVQEAMDTADEAKLIAQHGKVVKIIIQHCLANARSLITGQTFADIQYSSWQEDIPDYVAGKYYWARMIIYYADGTVMYSDPYFDMEAQVTAEVNIAVQEAQDTADEAERIAREASQTAGQSRKVFNTTPTPPYAVNDLWFDSAHGLTYLCSTAKAEGGTFAQSDWTVYSTDVSSHFWYDSSGAHIAENQGDVTTGASQTIASTGTVMMRNGKVITSWTGTNSGDAAINFYDLSSSVARDADLVASYGRAGITHYINNVVCQALTASGLSFFNPNSANPSNPDLEAVFGPAGTELYAGGDRAMSSTADYMTFYDTDTGEEVAKFGKSMSKIGKSGERQIYLDTSGIRLYAGNGHLMTSWTGTNAGSAAINFYDCSNTTANNSDLIASYINNVVFQALTASGLSFFNPNSANPSNPDLEAVFGPAGTELYAGGKKTMSSTADYMTFYDTTTLEEVAKFGKDIAKIGRDGARHIVIDSNGLRLYNGNGAEALANLGYGLGKDASGNNVIAPYFTLGVRDSSTVGNYSMVEGRLNSATAYCAHAEGNGTSAEAPYSHTEGLNTRATANSAHAGGIGNTANGEAQTVIGKYATIPDYENDLVLVGNGTSASNRSNAVRLRKDGYVEFAGPVGSRLYFADISHMITYAAQLNLYEPYLFTAGTTWGNQAGTGSYRAFGIIYKLSTTSYHLLFSSIGGKAYRSVFTVDSSDSTTGTFNTSQLDETSLSAAASTNAMAATPMADVTVPEVQSTENSEN